MAGLGLPADATPPARQGAPAEEATERNAALIREVLASLDLPEAGPPGDTLPLEAAHRIVRDTLRDLAEPGADPVALGYLTGHARRLAETLATIPRAAHPGARLLDVGCYGLMGYWAARHLGYAEVVGVEWLPDTGEAVIQRTVRVGADGLTFPVHNFDISGRDWPLGGGFDTVLLLEVLEHVNRDPSGVLTNIAARLAENGVLVASVPNCVSYKGLQEFLSGAPPWTYWFFHPDLRHEPRHAFEYTPVFFKAILRAAGLKEESFRTICAYADRAVLEDLFAIGRSMSIPEALFGDTMIARMRKVPGLPTIRFPDLIYDADRYYASTYPLLAPRRQAAVGAITARLEAADALRAQAEEQRLLAEQQRDLAERQLVEALMLADALRMRLEELDQNVLEEPRGLLARILFRADGRPTKGLRRLLFHADGRPRGAFRRFVLQNDGRPRRAFRRWMQSDAYRSMPGAVRAAADSPEADSGGRLQHPAGWPLWRRLLFRPDGRPVRALRRLLFRPDRQPRAPFRRLVLRKSGRPRAVFREWLARQAAPPG